MYTYIYIHIYTHLHVYRDIETETEREGVRGESERAIRPGTGEHSGEQASDQSPHQMNEGPLSKMFSVFFFFKAEGRLSVCVCVCVPAQEPAPNEQGSVECGFVLRVLLGFGGVREGVCMRDREREIERRMRERDIVFVCERERAGVNE